tara:strand:+ start:1937 stop:3034 length:1098 start_codon:yes stop_codon:yes gene_type:complete
MAYTTVDDPSAHFFINHYTGSGSSGLQVRNTANAGDLTPDWLWIKPTSLADNHVAFDSNRGFDKQLKVHETDAEDTHDPARITRETNGFDVDTTDQNYNQSSAKYVAWQWVANNASVTNFAESGANPGGSRQTNDTAGFSIINYTGTGSNGTIAHGMSAKPNMVVVKKRGGGGYSWYSHWTGLLPSGDNYIMYWNNTDNEQNNATAFNGTKPDNTNITVGTNGGTNGDGDEYIMYAFRNIKGYQKIGRYKGGDQSSGVNATNGPFVYTGFTPARVIIMNTESGSRDKTIWDSTRHPDNPKNIQLYLNLNNAHDSASTSSIIDFYSNGFKIRGNNQKINGGADAMIYWAIAEHPFVTSGGVPAPAR